MFGDQPFPEDRFAPAFLQQVPYERVKQIIAEVKAVIGPVFMVRALGGPEHLVVTKTHDLPVTIVLDANNDIAGCCSSRRSTARRRSRTCLPHSTWECPTPTS